MEYLGHEAEFRGSDVMAHRASKHILILGCGALGGWLTDLLVRQGYISLIVLDNDRVEKKNAGVQNFDVRDIGRKKARQTRARIFDRYQVNIGFIEDRLRQTNVKKILDRDPGFDLVIDVFDNTESRNLVRKACDDLNISCLHVGLSHDGFAEIEWNANYCAHPLPVEDDVEAPCEYPLAANLVHLAVGLAGEVVNQFMETGKMQSVHFTLRDLHVHLLEA